MATSLKARAMLSLGHGCGLRASEVARLRVCDIDNDQSKGRKDRKKRPTEPCEMLSTMPRLAVHNRKRPRQTQKAIPSVRMTRATRSPCRKRLKRFKRFEQLPVGGETC
jgi:integrase